MIDTHSHIDTEIFDEDRSEMLERAWDNGLENIIIPSIMPSHFDKVKAVAESDNRIYFGVGVHPHNSSEYNDEVELDIKNRLNHPKAIAVGEIGLDYYYDFAPKETQIDVFTRQLKIAKELKLPVIVHNRESDEDVLNCIKQEQDGNLSGVLHCFSSTLPVLKTALDLGFHVSFTGNITYKKSILDEVVKYVPNDRVMIETDAPYMTPIPNRGKRNEPSNVKYIAEKIAEIKNLSFEKVVEMTTENAKRLFKIALIIFCFSFSFSFSQNNDSNDDLAVDSVKVNPYKKGLGIGFFGGPNTIVETDYVNGYGKDSKAISYEGIAALGGNINFGLFDFLLLEASYVTSKNTKIQKERQNTGNPIALPDITNILEFSSKFIANPDKKINIFGAIGLTYYNNSINGVTQNALGFNGGIGFIVNVPTPSYGLFTFEAQWRIDFRFVDANIINATLKSGVLPDPITGKYKYPDDYNVSSIKASTYYSIPRFGIVWYPPL